ncbi:hypothetical protein MRD56_17100 [Clostridioides difficile]|nr:hypothetical protein [Clostridioides difficile]MCP3358684.1 hypothetical protein [Clostridioides difficile]
MDIIVSSFKEGIFLSVSIIVSFISSQHKIVYNIDTIFLLSNFFTLLVSIHSNMYLSSCVFYLSIFSSVSSLRQHLDSPSSNQTSFIPLPIGRLPFADSPCPLIPTRHPVQG